MADEQQQQQAEPPKEFDYVAYKAARDAGQQPARPGTPAPVEAKPVKAGEAEDDGDDEGDHADNTPKLPRSIRRELNKLRRENGELAGRLAMMTELQAQGYTKAEAKQQVDKIEAATGEPTRDQFQTDHEYYKALAKFEVRAEMTKGQQTAAQNAEFTQYMATVEKANAKFSEDVTLYPDWTDVAEAMDETPLDAQKQSTFIALLSASDQRAHILYHLAKHEGELKSLLAMTPSAQIALFHRLEGRMETKHAKKEEPEKKKPTAAELDAKKAKPSEAVAVKGGQAVAGVPAMMLADGRTLNPAWKAARNAAAGLRA